MRPSLRRRFAPVAVATLALAATGIVQPAQAAPPLPAATVLQRTNDTKPVDSFALLFNSISPTPSILNGSLYFPAFRPDYGFELWKTNGIQGGTNTGASLVMDLVPGPAGGVASAPLVMNNMLYFLATSSATGEELWKSDGTAAGTSVVKDIRPGMHGSDIAQLTVNGNMLYFVADNGTNGQELWKSDGTAAGTSMVSDINPGSAHSGISHMIAGPNNTVIFSADDGTHGDEPWSGTATSVVRLNTYGAATTNPDNFVLNGDTVYFAADTPTQGRELVQFKSNTITIFDTVAGATGGEPRGITVYGTGVVFSATTAAAGRELWKSDGTAAGTALAQDINPGAGSSDPSGFTSLTPLGASVVMFSANDGTKGDELWFSNLAGTTYAVDLNPGSGSSSPSTFTIASGKVFFVATNGTNGKEAWRYTLGGSPTMIKDINPGNNNSFAYLVGFVPFGNGVMFMANDGSTGNELWFTDGTTSSTIQIQNIAPDQSTSLFTPMGVINGRAVFRRTASASLLSASYLNELWVSDGTASGTGLIRNFEPESGVSIAGYSAGAAQMILSGFIYFAAEGDSSGTELWRTDGTAAGTTRVADIRSGSDSSSPRLGVVYNGALYFAANDGSTGNELWRTNGTTTERVSDINPGFGGSAPDWLTVVGDTLFFVAENSQGEELWRLNGAGLALVKDINPGSSFSNPSSLVNHNGTLFFRADDGTNGIELWKSDGTAAGTTLVRDINPGSVSSYPNNLTTINNTLFFSAGDGSHGDELWKSDGTTAGTTLVADLTAGQESSSLLNFRVVNNRLLFMKMEGDNQSALWTSDGSAAGTTTIPGPRLQFSLSGVSFFYDVAPSVAVFSAWDAEKGLELWMTDGTDANTRRLTDLAPGGRQSFPTGAQVVGDKLVFGARDTTSYGFWTLPGKLINERYVYLPLQNR